MSKGGGAAAPAPGFPPPSTKMWQHEPVKAHRHAKHPPRAVRTDNCHLSFPRVSVGGQAYEHFRRYVAPCTLDSVRRARGIHPRDASKPHGKSASTTSPPRSPAPRDASSAPSFSLSTHPRNIYAKWCLVSPTSAWRFAVAKLQRSKQPTQPK